MSQSMTTSSSSAVSRPSSSSSRGSRPPLFVLPSQGGSVRVTAAGSVEVPAAGLACPGTTWRVTNAAPTGVVRVVVPTGVAIDTAPQTPHVVDAGLPAGARVRITVTRRRRMHVAAVAASAV